MARTSGDSLKPELAVSSAPLPPVPCEAVTGGDKPVWNAGLNDDIASTEAGFKYRVGFFSRVSTRRVKSLEQLVERERLCAKLWLPSNSS